MNPNNSMVPASTVSPAAHGGSKMYSTAYANLNPQTKLPSSWTGGADLKAQHDSDFAEKQKMIDDQYTKMVNQQSKNPSYGYGGDGGRVRGAVGSAYDSKWLNEQREWEREDRKYSLGQRDKKFDLEQQMADAEYLKAIAVFLQAGGNIGMLKDNPTASKFLSGIYKNTQNNPSGANLAVPEIGSKLPNGARVFSTTTSADGSLTGYKAQWDPLPMTGRSIRTAPNGARVWSSPYAGAYGYGSKLDGALARNKAAVRNFYGQ